MKISATLFCVIEPTINQFIIDYEEDFRFQSRKNLYNIPVNYWTLLTWYNAIDSKGHSIYRIKCTMQTIEKVVNLTNLIVHSVLWSCRVTLYMFIITHRYSSLYDGIAHTFFFKVYLGFRGTIYSESGWNLICFISCFVDRVKGFII